MSARGLLDRAEATGVSVLAENGKIVFRGEESAIAALVPEARAHKAELLEELTNPAVVTQNEPLPRLDPQSEARRRRVLELLATNQNARYALVTDADTEPEFVILTLAIRGQATCELRVPLDKYDGFLLLDLLNRYGGTIH